MLQGHPEPPVSTSESGSFSTKARLILIVAVLALALGYLVFAAFPGSTRYYVTVSEFLADDGNLDGRSIRVVGKLVPESFERVSGTTQANFVMMDGGQVLDATYDGVLPDLFFNPHSDIVLEGRYGEEGVFHTDLVIVKCPSKYQAVMEEV
jgi:cytochrome c-type biogenesis protein CcmE